MVGREGEQANLQVCLLWYSAVQDGMVGREAKQAQVCLLWYSAMPAVWLCGKESRQTRKFACFGIARCKTRCLGGKQSVCLPALV